MKNKKLIIIICFLGLISIVSGIYFSMQSNTSLDKGKTEVKTTKKKKKKVNTYQSPIPDYQKNYNNNDIIAELSIPALNLKEAVAKGKDNDFYLNHDLSKNESKTGSILVDYRTTDINKAKQINIYGHNSDYYTLPFKSLEKYLDDNFVKDNSLIYLNTDKYSFTYKIYAIKIFTTEDEHTIISFDDSDEFLKHIALMRENAKYDSGEQLAKDDDILILQTCLYDPVDTKLLVMAKKEK